MSPDRASRMGAAAAVLAAVLSCGAQAQTPQRTTASYDDWTVRCEMRGTPPVKHCEMVQAVTAQGQTAPVAQLAVGRANAKEPVRAVFQVPVNVWIATGVRFLYDPKTAALPASFRWCVPAGCFAVLELKDDMLKRMRGLAAPGRFEFKDAGQRDVAIPVSFKGFAQALDALAKE